MREIGLLCGCAAVVAIGAVFKMATPSTAAPTASSAPAAEIDRLSLPRGREEPSAEPAPPPETGCSIAERGFGTYVEAGAGSQSEPRLFVSADDVGESYTLLIHLHGGDAIRKLVLPENPGLVLATIDRGAGSSSYAGIFRDRKTWDGILASLDARVAKVVGHPARASSVIVSSWSAGYKAVEGLLPLIEKDDTVAGIVLLDSLHSGYAPGLGVLAHGQLTPFVRAARRAANGGGFFFEMAHSEIVPPGYASTTETAEFVLKEIGVASTRVESGGTDPLPLVSVAQKGRLDVRGYRGDDAPAHCDELRLLPGILKRELDRKKR